MSLVPSENSSAWSAAMAVVLSFVAGCRSEPDPRRQPIACSLGLGVEPTAALAIIAHRQGYFRDAGLEVSVREYASGKRAMEALAASEVEVATSADVPVVLHSFRHDELRIVGTIASTDTETRLLARRDRGIERPADLKGKRIATQQGSAVHFFLHLFLLRHGLSERDVTLSFLPAEELTPALIRGDVDAISMREPYLGIAQTALGENAVVFVEPGLYSKTYHVVLRSKLLAERPEVVRRLLVALLRAEQFAREHRPEGIAIVAEALHTDRRSVEELWQEAKLEVTLDQAVLLTLEDVAEWARQDGLVPAAATPNYLNFVHWQTLHDLRPRAVTIIH